MIESFKRNYFVRGFVWGFFLSIPVILLAVISDFIYIFLSFLSPIFILLIAILSAFLVFLFSFVKEVGISKFIGGFSSAWVLLLILHIKYFINF